MAKRRRNRPTSNVTPRPLNESENIARVVRDEVAKAISAGVVSSPNNAQTYLQSLALRSQRPIAQDGTLPRSPYLDATFGPGDPLVTSPLSPALPSGRPSPRQFEYLPSANLQFNSDKSVPWEILRNVADNVSIVRSCIEVCKSALTGLDWSFSIDTSKARALAKRSNTSNHEVIADLQDKFADDIDRLHQWWKYPMLGVPFSEWLGAIIEDELVLDAVAIYPRFSLGSDLLAAEFIDGSTIKPILDERGATPLPPMVAFQQILNGFPRGDYSAASTPSGDIEGEYAAAVYGGPLKFRGARTDALIYKVSNRRTSSPYGFSCVEQALPDVDLWLKRTEWLRSEYTAGVTPQMIANVDAAMTAEQMREWESIVNDDLSGRTQDRHRAKLFPNGFDVQFPPGFEAKFANDLDLHLIRLICASFDVLPTTLGFVPNHGMGGAGGKGQQQGESDSQLERGTKPRAKRFTEVINDLSIKYLGMPPEVTFQFHGIDDEDEQRRATLLEGYIGNALMTPNEGRDAINLPRSPHPQANELLFLTPTGPAYLDPSIAVGMPGNLPSAEQNAPGAAPALPNGAKPDPPAPPAGPRDESVQNSPNAARAEQKAFMTFVRNRNRGGEWRDFTFKALNPDVGTAANELAKAGHVDAVKALFDMYDDAT